MNNKTRSDDFFNRVWIFFASVRLSVVLLLTLAVTSIIGTVIPQNQPQMFYQQNYPGIYPIIEALDLHIMYGSWWFRLLLSLLIVNIVVCSVERLSSMWKVYFPKKINFNADRFRKSSNRTEWVSEQSADELKTGLARYMEKTFRNIRVEEKTDGYLIFGEKGRWTRLGVYIVHFSIILLMLGALIGSIFGFEGYMNVAEGETESTFNFRDSGETGNLDFQIRCDDFTVSHYPSGRPKDFRSELAIIENDNVAVEGTLRVNDPIKHRGISIFQSSYGRIPGDSFTVVFTDPEENEKLEKRASMGEEIEMPNGNTFIVEDFTTGFNFRGHNIGPTFLTRLIPENGQPEPIILPMEYPQFDRMRKGDFVISIENMDYRYYTGLQIARDPGVPVVYAGFIAMIVGIYITFFMFHQQVGIELTRSGNGTTVAVSGISPKHGSGMKNVIKRQAEKIGRLT